jgi:medium-chain acyl-[acyl-carrier-protein] hydrolase
MGEPFYADMDEAAEDAAAQLTAHYESRSEDRMIAIFGHSMGSTLAFEVCRRLSAAGSRAVPSHLFCSGRAAPQAATKRKRIHSLSDEQFQEEIMRLGATPAAVFQEKALLDTYMPILRADYTLIEQYRYRESAVRLSCDLTVLHGIEEDSALEDLEGWRIHTSGSYRRKSFPGGHFYLNDQPRQVAEWLNRTLTREVQLYDRIYAGVRLADSGVRDDRRE